MAYSNLLSPTAGSTPATNALLGKISPQPLQPLVGALAPKPSLTLPKAPASQAVKSHIVNADGSHETTYHDPDKTPSTGVSAKPQPLANNFSAGGVGNGQQGTAPTQTYQAPAITGQTTTPSGATVDASSGGLIQAPNVQPPQQQNPFKVGVQGLLNIGQNGSQAYTDAQKYAQSIQDKLAQSRLAQANSLEANANDPVDIQFQTGRANNLNEKYLAQQTALSNEYGAATNLIGAANTQQGQQASAFGGAIGATAPQAYGLTTQPYNPYTDTFGGGGTNGAIDRATQAGNIGSAQGFAQDYNTGKAKLATADGIQSQIVATLKNTPGLNDTSITPITELNELFSGVSSKPGQQLLSQQIANYIQTLGLDPASVANIAHQQKGTLSQLLDSLRQTAETQVESKNPANLKSGSSSTPKSSSGGDIYNF